MTGAAPVMVPARRDQATGEPWTATADDVAWFTAEMTGGAVAQVFISGVAAHTMPNVTQVFGSRGTVTLGNDDERLWLARAGGTFRRSPRRIRTPACRAWARASGTSRWWR